MTFFDELKSDYMSAPGENDVMGLIKNTAFNAAAGTAGRYVYYKFVGDFLNKFLGNFFGKYANIGVSAVYSMAMNIIATKVTDNQRYSNLIQLAGSVPISDYLAKALGDPMLQLNSTASQQASGADGQEAAEIAEVQKLMGSAPSVTMQSTRGY